jgi:transcriptional regulator with GAF, ATPase, and Fis domain
MTDPSGLQAVVDALAADLGCPVLVEDAQHHPLWWSAQESPDEVRMRTILRRLVAPEARAMVSRLQLARATHPVRTPEIAEIGMRERWCVPIRSGGTHLGYLWVEDGDGHIGDDQLPRLQECADLAAEALARERSTYEDLARKRSALLDRLLHAPDEAAARELVALEHLAHDVRVVVRVPAQVGGWQLPGGMSAHVWRPRAAPAASGPALPLAELREAVRRAACTRRALVAGARLERPSWDALGVWRLIVEAPESLSVSEIHPGAEVLASAPRTDLMATARVVLDLGGDVAAAAEELRVHRTTLYYRLDRIRELTGVDLRTGVGRTDLQLALWLAAYRRAGT